MRRVEFLVTDPALIGAVFEEAESGCLGLIDETGAPYQTQVNLVWAQGALWFHSGPLGTKIKLIKACPKVHVSVVLASSFVPSYATDPQKPCSATQFFRSVHVKGEAQLVEDLGLKAQILGLLMQKLQPEGGYQPLEQYPSALRSVALVQIIPQEITGKFKFGQNLTAQKRQDLIKTLQESADPRAQEALAWINRLA
ncbi:MAG: hypothetical protein A2527_04975 [Candidatus Lambdaproteobacteria bacterium RIFOXYD2_FULL_50_16]|uniref:Pyridoxamine 5'-phosphate oxidase putative domain-containing protein n=1 Tax=Candidatus Lambdaproteobacteria bacterium RIFOXYD2_FULL_50_16 TaxID=1817772 RepID=A0A1F6G834_9PROT|nr:MAG: hypothetical protein A2527_04975 [Candidatus Lambdaproteobacteria bacterium RIFOXYD2_FULL_50_16]